MSEPNPDQKNQEMLTTIFKVALGVAIAMALMFCGVFGYIGWSKSKYLRLKDTHDLRERIKGYAGDYMKIRPHAALGIGVIQGGRMETFFFGQMSKDNPAKPDLDTVFEIGSVTKVFTALMSQKLVADGVWKWSDSVRDVLPREVALMPVFDQMELFHLVTHQSGLPRLPKNLEPEKVDMANPYKDYGTNDLYEYLGIHEGGSAPGKKILSSSLGYGLLGHLCEVAGGKSYGELMSENIFRPLGMTHSSAELIAGDNLAVGHSSEGNEVPHWNFQALAGAGVLKSSMGDLLKFMDANMNPTNSPLGAVLLECQQEHAKSMAGDVGYGWQLTTTLQGQLDFVWHHGGTGGFVSFIGFDRTHTNAVVMLSSSGDAMKGDFYLDTLAMEILKLASKVSME